MRKNKKCWNPWLDETVGGGHIWHNTDGGRSAVQIREPKDGNDRGNIEEQSIFVESKNGGKHSKKLDHKNKTSATRENCVQSAPPKLSCLCANARSIQNKFEELELYVQNEKPHVIGITESWTTDEIADSEISLNGYTLFRRDRGENKRGGGVLLYVSSDLVVSLRDDIGRAQLCESVWCDIICGAEKTLLGVCYRPPDSKAEDDEKLFETLKVVSDETVLIMGDFNFPNINWDLKSAGNCSSNKFLDCIQDCFLWQHVDVATRGDNILDLVLSSEENIVENLRIGEPFGTSDHCVIRWDMVVTKKCEATANKTYFDYYKADYEQIKAAAKQMDLESSVKGVNVEEDWLAFKTNLENLRDVHVPNRRNKNRNAKWIDRNVIRRTRAKNKAWRRYRKLKTETSYAVYKQKLQQSVKAIKNAKVSFEKKLAYNIKGDSKSFYSYVRNKQRTKDKVGPLKDHSGKIILDDKDAANHLNDYFVTVFTKENGSNIPILENRIKEEDNLNKIVIDENMVKKKLDQLKTDKSPGADGIHPRLLKELSNVISKPLASLFQNSLDSGVVPEDWRKANISGIYKKGSKADSQNYRPISLTSIVCKIMESLIKDEIVGHLEKFELIKSSQHGFIKGRSCLTNLLDFFNEITRLLDSGKPVDVIYLDFAKAFDKVPHKRLLCKVKSHGISGQVLEWISVWLQNRQQRVTLNGKFSEWNEVISGVPQGSVLGPLLFLIFINDLDNGIVSKICKFADDTKLGGAVSNNEEISVLRNDLAKLCEWADTWQMKFNVDKCVVMHFGNHNNTCDYEMDGHKLKQSTSERDLGVIVCNTGKPSKQCLTAANKANSTLGMIKRNIKSRDKDIIVRLYKTLVRPKLEYCIQAWNPFLKKDVEVLEKVQKRATKLVTACRNYSYEERLQILDLQPLNIRRIRGDMIEVFKLVKGIERIDASKFFTLSETTQLRGHDYKLIKYRSRLDIRKHYFSNRVVSAWNSLPRDVVAAESINSFKARLDKFIKKDRRWGRCSM